MKQLLTIHAILLIALAALCGCASDEYLGSAADAADVERGQTISFSGAANRFSRANMLTGAEAAAKLNNTFVVFGSKTTGGTTQTVFDHYTVAYTPNTAMTTASNSADWEYVGQTINEASPLAGTQQTIKYWDFSAEQYDFVAFATGGTTQIAPSGTPAAGQVAISPVVKDALTTQAYTISGAADDVANIYISDRITALKSSATTLPGRLSRYQEAVIPTFRQLGAKMRLGLYETVSGYSVKNVQFYTTAADPSTPSTTPALFCSNSATIPCGATGAIVKFPETNRANDAYNRATVAYTAESEKAAVQTFGALTYGVREDQETPDNIYLGRTPADASLSGDATVLPAALDALNLKVDFTLVSIDYNETIDIKGASATVPAAFTQLQPNTNYTYLFKITDAVTDAFGQRLLYPVQFDALEITDDIGEQHTMTTIDQPSITTYAKGQLNTNAVNGSIWDYYKGDHIYISVMNGTEKLLTDENSKLFRITITDDQASWYEVTEQNIFTYISRINAGTHWFTMTDITDSELKFVTEIPAADSSTGAAVSANNGYNFAWFTANDGTANDEIYAFRYKNRDEVRYTQDEIDAAKATINAPGYVDGSDPYAEELATKTADTVKTPIEYHYKVIRVQKTPRP